MTQPEHYEPLTPIQCEQRLFNLTVARGQATKALTEAADAVVDAEEDLTMAKATLEYVVADVIALPACPTVGRGDGGVTCADRDAWVVRCTRKEREAVVGATALVRRRRAVRDAARRQITEISEQMMAAECLLKSANEAYRGIGSPH